MNIVVLSGSPRKGANTDIMVEAFAQAAREQGHTVEVVPVARKRIAGCLGCKYCFSHEGVCAQKDEMGDVIESLKSADMVVFASPIYWFDITARRRRPPSIACMPLAESAFPSTRRLFCSIAIAMAFTMQQSRSTGLRARIASGKTRALLPLAV